MAGLLFCRQIEKIFVESFRSEKIMKNKPHLKVNKEFLKFKFCDGGTFICRQIEKIFMESFRTEKIMKK